MLAMYWLLTIIMSGGGGYGTEVDEKDREIVTMEISLPINLNYVKVR